MSQIDAAACLGTHDLLFITLDTLRYDVAAEAAARGETPNLAGLLPNGTWELRHSPASFTFAAHQAFFAGFLPTPAEPREIAPERHHRLFAARFPGSETTGTGTLVFDTPDIVTGFAAQGYRTICIGGTGFFNKRSALGSVLPGLFDESWWDESLGVGCRDSAANQVARAVERVEAQPAGQRLFLFVNIAACHPPHHFYGGEDRDDAASQRAALADVDRHLPALFAAMRARAPVLAILCSDHGTAFGEDGYHGHRIGHRSVWDVPYAQMILPQREVAA
ncbi:metalloenzyme domain-containing protein [Sphingomonas populi]|uniref:Metalloenzyme domain-containing protein n=1 Tax=Sphingomonas populi TaxID=2484750 RepID=A0A4Q6XWK1_9SPHN|nr:STM4013/SEN3800 family hydrolase [Sphingomonas populi]RZF65103.1 metalloenzyme domain-containing protein [Sphingomonas populi]